MRDQGHSENPFFKLFERKELVERAPPFASESKTLKIKY